MDAIITRVPGRQLETAAADRLQATRRLACAALRAAGDALVNYSRAGMLVRSGSRPRRRL
jgi:hypothetical protein